MRWLVAIFLLIVPGHVAAGEMTVVTEEAVAFTEGRAKYSVGMNAAEFEARFGTPERKRVFGADPPSSFVGKAEWQYINDGLELLLDADSGTIRAFTFFVTPNRGYRAANVKTDAGIAAGASLREIVRIHGEPSHRRSFPGGAGGRVPDMTSLIYRRQNGTLLFIFEAGILGRIVMNDARN